MKMFNCQIFLKTKSGSFFFLCAAGLWSVVTGWSNFLDFFSICFQGVKILNCQILLKKQAKIRTNTDSLVCLFMLHIEWQTGGSYWYISILKYLKIFINNINVIVAKDQDCKFEFEHVSPARPHSFLWAPIRMAGNTTQHSVHTDTHTHTHTHARTYTHARTRARTHTHTHVRAHTHTHTWKALAIVPSGSAKGLVNM